jgi:hypothetical protein
MSAPTASKKTHDRNSYEDRTGMTSRAAIHLAQGHFEKIQFTEDEAGNRIRVWKSSESSSYTTANLKECLSNPIAIEPNEMLGAPLSNIILLRAARALQCRTFILAQIKEASSMYWGFCLACGATQKCCEPDLANTAATAATNRRSTAPRSC